MEYGVFSSQPKRSFIIVLFCVKAVFHVHCKNQAALMSHLFSNYDSSVRPNCQGPLTVYVGLAVRQVIDLDEPKQILYLNTWIRLKWSDCQLTWNISDYANITNLILPYDKLWTPDITLYDSAETDLDAIRGYRVSVYSDGTVYYNYPYRIASMCNVDVTYFPYDTQRCPLQFGSWAYHGFDLDIQNRSVAGDISSFVTNTEFDIPEIPLVRHELKYGCCPEPYPDVTFYVILRRKPTFYVLNLLFPCVLITSVAMLGFILPPDSGEKIGLEITVLLSLAVFQLVVSDSLPASSETFPYIGVYFASAMVLVMVSTVLTVLVLNAHHTECRTLPTWMRVVFLDYLARVVCYGKPLPTSGHPNGADTVYPNGGVGYTGREGQNGVKEHHQQNGEHRVGSVELIHIKKDNSSEVSLRLPPVPPASQSNPPSLEMSHLIRILTEQRKLMKKQDARKEQKVEHDHQKSEWIRLAIVMDRLFMILFALSSVITALAILIPLSSK